MGHCVREIALQLEREPEIVVCFGVIRMPGERAAIAGFGKRLTALRSVGKAAIQHCGRPAGQQLQRAVVAGDRFDVAREHAQRIAAVVVRIREMRIEPCRLAIVHERALEESLFGECNSQIVVCARRLRLQLQRPRIGWHRLRITSRLHECVACSEAFLDFLSIELCFGVAHRCTGLRRRIEAAQRPPRFAVCLERAILAFMTVAPLTARALCVSIAVVAACVCGQSVMASADREQAFAVLVFSKTAGFRHDSIPAGTAAVKTLGEQHRFTVDATEDATLFADAALAKYRTVVFLNTTGHVLDPSQQAAFERFIRRGGGFVGIHSATDTEYDWPWYRGLVGTYFLKHPPIQPAVLKVLDAAHLSTKHLPAEWPRTDEWYNFRDDPSARVNVLLRIEESSYTGGSMGSNHPMAWYHAYDGGKAWYTALGHTIESYREPAFLQHLLGGILWSAGVTTTP